MPDKPQAERPRKLRRDSLSAAAEAAAKRFDDLVPPQAGVEDELPGEIVARPDGYHWITRDGRQEFGPFETLEQARAFRVTAVEGGASSAEDLLEAEQDIGIAGWIDPETGEPAEGASPPHLDQG